MRTTTDPTASGAQADAAFALFATPIGACAIAWRGDAIIATALPEPTEQALRHRMARRYREAEPPPHVAAAIQRIAGFLSGQGGDLSTIALDLTAVSPFERLVYTAARAIPTGETRTYGELAETIGAPGAARAVGVALGRNPWPIVVPCHRILAAGGRSGGFSAPGGAATKLKLLDIEGARRGGEADLFGGLPWAMRQA